MPERIVRRSKNRKFAYAAVAMGEFWERARRREAQRIERLQRALLKRAAHLVVTPSISRPAGVSPG